jgi:hypothetical protein
MKHLSLRTCDLTSLPNKKRAEGHCLAGSLTGEVASKKVTEAYKGRLSTDGNRT